MADQIITIPKGWKITTLGEVADIIMGQSPSGESYNQKNDGLPFYQGITEFGDKYVDIKTFTNAPTKIIEANSILFSVRAPVGKVNFTKHKACIGRGNAGLKMKNGQQNFLYFLLKKSEKAFLSNTTGTVFDSISGVQLRGFEVLIPEREEEQSAIAAVLSSLDDKIELLREQNKTLETTAQAIFKEWFVNFNFPGTTGKMIDSELGEIPEGWRVGRLGDEFEIIMGQSPNGESYNEVQRGKVFFQGRAEFQDRFPKTRLYTTEPKRMAEKFDVLVSVRAPVGDINVAAEDCCIGRGLAAVRSINKSYTLYKIKSLKEVFGKFEAEGTVFGSINKDNFANVQVIIPVLETIRQFENVVSSLDEKIYINYSQIQILSKLRDTLLPKLMRGDVRVKGFEN